MVNQAKIDHVTGHFGGTISEINLVTLVAPASVLLWSVLQSKLSLFTPYSTPACSIDFLLNCAAILFATTLYSSSPAFLNLLLLFPASLVLISSSLPKRRKLSSRVDAPNIPKTRDDLNELLPFKPFVTSYRGSMMVITCVAILAVDFKVFPRRFAKVENWGTSLMDLGVGSFVFSAGTVSAKPILKEQLAMISPSLGARMSVALRRCLPLIILGFVRMYSVKGLEYAEHVTEYGVHWNFFFTMALMAPMSALFDATFKILPSYSAISLILGIAYEALLDLTELKTYIMAAPRTDLLSKNREGVFSFIGYLAIFLAGRAIGMHVLLREQPNNTPAMSLLSRLSLWSSIWTLLFMFTTSYTFGLNLQVSRRLANLPYFLWVAAFNCTQLTSFYIIEKLLFPDAQRQGRKARDAASRLLQAFNHNGLALFLLANLLTGLVNLTLPTLKFSDFQAMFVLLAYSAVLSAVALFLHYKDITIKL